MIQQTISPIKVFYIYADEATDIELRDLLEVHLSSLRRQGLIFELDSRKILPGSEREREIYSFLDTANIILLLVSPDFVHSDWCYSIGMNRALERRRKGDAHVIPIILRPTDLIGTPLSGLQALPTDKKPITLRPNKDQALQDVVFGVRRVVEELSLKQELTNLLASSPKSPLLPIANGCLRLVSLRLFIFITFVSGSALFWLNEGYLWGNTTTHIMHATLIFIGLGLGLIGWVSALIQTIHRRQWGWLILLLISPLLLFSPVFLYALFGHPSHKLKRRGFGRNPRLRTKILLFVSVILCFLVVIPSFYTTSIAHDQDVSADATSRAIFTATDQAQSTVAAATDAATATAMDANLAQITSRAPDFSYSLSGTSSNDWPHGENTIGGCEFTHNTYHDVVHEAGHLGWCSLLAHTFGEFAFQIQMTILSGDRGGISFRVANDNSGAFYGLLIDDTGHYELYFQDSLIYKSLAVIYTSSWRVGQPNQIAVVTRGNMFDLYINGQYSWTAQDNGPIQGGIAVLAKDDNNLTDIAFNNAQIWDL